MQTGYKSGECLTCIHCPLSLTEKTAIRLTNKPPNITCIKFHGQMILAQYFFDPCEFYEKLE